jgi:pyruvate/2-oxoglutarate dehydrogenase complex dihydrolipoamide acyltransferase (E2) component
VSNTYVVISSHEENLACGQMVAPGESSTRVDPSDPHDESLIRDGVLKRIEQTEIKASPEAEAKAKELEIDINTVNGTGSGGLIKVADVEEAAEQAETDDEENEEDD